MNIYEIIIEEETNTGSNLHPKLVPSNQRIAQRLTQLHPEFADELGRALDNYPGQLRVNSATRTEPEQKILRRNYQSGQSNIPASAGVQSHGGYAVDINRNDLRDFHNWLEAEKKAGRNYNLQTGLSFKNPDPVHLQHSNWSNLAAGPKSEPTTVVSKATPNTAVAKPNDAQPQASTPIPSVVSRPDAYQGLKDAHAGLDAYFRAAQINKLQRSEKSGKITKDQKTELDNLRNLQASALEKSKADWEAKQQEKTTPAVKPSGNVPPNPASPTQTVKSKDTTGDPILDKAIDNVRQAKKNFNQDDIKAEVERLKSNGGTTVANKTDPVKSTAQNILDKTPGSNAAAATTTNNRPKGVDPSVKITSFDPATGAWTGRDKNGNPTGGGPITKLPPALSVSAEPPPNVSDLQKKADAGNQQMQKDLAKDKKYQAAVNGTSDVDDIRHTINKLEKRDKQPYNPKLNRLTKDLDDQSTSSTPASNSKKAELDSIRKNIDDLEQRVQKLPNTPQEPTGQLAGPSDTFIKGPDGKWIENPAKTTNNAVSNKPADLGPVQDPVIKNMKPAEINKQIGIIKDPVIKNMKPAEVDTELKKRDPPVNITPAPVQVAPLPSVSNPPEVRPTSAVTTPAEVKTTGNAEIDDLKNNIAKLVPSASNSTPKLPINTTTPADIKIAKTTDMPTPGNPKIPYTIAERFPFISKLI